MIISFDIWFKYIRSRITAFITKIRVFISKVKDVFSYFSSFLEESSNQLQEVFEDFCKEVNSYYLFQHCLILNGEFDIFKLPNFFILDYCDKDQSLELRFN